MKGRDSVFLRLSKITVFVAVATALLLAISSCVPKKSSLSEERFGLSEDSRKEIFKELVLAEDQAERDIATMLEEPTTKSFQVGDSFTLTKETPLMPELDPGDPLAALQQVQKLPVDSTIKVLQVSERDGTPWYFVEATSSSIQDYLGRGWINSIALAEQTRIPFEEQVRRLSEVRKSLREKYKSAVASKYGLTLDQLKEISKEGDEKAWPLP